MLGQCSWSLPLGPERFFPKGPGTIIVGVWAPKVCTIPLLGDRLALLSGHCRNGVLFFSAYAAASTALRGEGLLAGLGHGPAAVMLLCLLRGCLDT